MLTRMETRKAIAAIVTVWASSSARGLIGPYSQRSSAFGVSFRVAIIRAVLVLRGCCYCRFIPAFGVACSAEVYPRLRRIPRMGFRIVLLVQNCVPFAIQDRRREIQDCCPRGFRIIPAAPLAPLDALAG